MEPIKLLLLFLGIINIILAFIFPEYYNIINIVIGWLCLVAAHPDNSIWKNCFI